MQNLLKRIDQFAGIDRGNNITAGLERTAFVFLFLTVLSAPHSIAATQIAWLSGMLAWVIRLCIRPRPVLVRSPLDIPIWIFFTWTVLTAFFSYEPLISISKLRGAALFLIFYFVINNLRNIRVVKFLIMTLVMSCMVNVLWMPIERIFGRGVEIHGIREESPLKKALLWEGDTLLKANGKPFKNPDELVASIGENDITRLLFYRPDFYFTVEVKRADLLGGASALENLGISSWKRSRNWRSQGFYGHYATYAEVLQLILSLVFGLFIAGMMASRTDAGKWKSQIKLLVCLIGMSFALLLTVTRGSQLGFLISALCIVMLSRSRKLILVLALIALPVVIGGLIFLQQSREVGFFDQSDQSTTYRQTIYREGINLWLQNPRHFLIGVGMDTITKNEYVSRWHLFDDGKLEKSHFHSTPIQLLVERGLFGLLFWLLFAGVYLGTLWKGVLAVKDETAADFQLKKGIILGCFGGTVGLFTSGLVHYNIGDSEVAMVFYLLAGMGVFVCESLLKQDQFIKDSGHALLSIP